MNNESQREKNESIYIKLYISIKVFQRGLNHVFFLSSITSIIFFFSKIKFSPRSLKGSQRIVSLSILDDPSFFNPFYMFSFT